MRSFFSYPNPVNEVTARVIAGGVVVLSGLTIGLQLRWLAIPLAAGFLLRVLWGPRLSPMALVASRVIVPRLPFAPKSVAGPPKRFAQLVGLLFCVAALVLLFGLSLPTAGYAVLGALLAAALLESAGGICLGCIGFGLLIRVGIIPAQVCESCNDIWSGRRPPSAPAPSAS